MNIINSAKLPKNLTIEISGGSLVPGELNSIIIISADSISKCSKYNPSKPMINSQEKFQFELTDVQKNKIWNVINKNDFFSLDKEYKDSNILDGFFIEIEVSTDNKSHTVMIQNYHQKNVENIIKTINAFLPLEFQFKW